MSGERLPSNADPVSSVLLRAAVTEDGRLSPVRFASRLGVTLEQMAALCGVDRAHLLAVPEDGRIQGFLQDSLDVLDVAIGLCGSEAGALRWYRQVALEELGVNEAARHAFDSIPQAGRGGRH